MTAITNLPWATVNTAAEIQIAIEALFGKLAALETSKMQDAELVPLALSLKAACDYAGKVDAEINLRVLTLGKAIPGAATKDATVHRIWSDKDVAAELAREKFGDKAFSAPALLSPAGIEKLGADGKAFVALCSEKPSAPKKVVY